MRDLALLLIGSGIGGCIVGLALNRRYGQILNVMSGQLRAIIAEHNEIVRGLIERLNELEGKQ